jgi:hypothetical protein
MVVTDVVVTMVAYGSRGRQGEHDQKQRSNYGLHHVTNLP